MFSSCAGIRKAEAGRILKQCTFNLDSWTLDSVALDPKLFPATAKEDQSLFPNSQVLKLAQDLLQGKNSAHLGTAWIGAQLQILNASSDTLMIDSLHGLLMLDTLIRTDWLMTQKTVLKPGANSIPLRIVLPMDGRLFHIMEPDTMLLQGYLDARLKSGGSIIPLQFSQKRPTPKDSIRVFIKKAQNDIFQSVLNGWAGSL